MDPVLTCFYVPTGTQHIIRSGCTPGREWIPQDDMPYCPFCGKVIKALRIATPDDLPDPPLKGLAA